MTVDLTDKGERQILEGAYDGEDVIVGLYNEDNDVSYSRPETTDGFEDYIDGVYNDPETTSNVPANTVAPGERPTVSRVEQAEPNRAESYSRQTVEASVEYVRRDAGRIDLSRDLFTRVSLPSITFDVSDSERIVNAVFVVLADTGNLHLTIPLDERIVLDEIDDELVVNGVELFIE